MVNGSDQKNEAVGKTSSGSNVKTTYANQGWHLSTSGASTVTVSASAGLKTGTSGTEYAKYTYVLHNNSDQAVSGYKLGLWTDVQIGDNDYAPISAMNYGFMMEDTHTSCSTAGLGFALVANSDVYPDGLTGSTTCTSYWYGRYYQASNNVFNSTSTQYLTGLDSGAAISWQNITIPAGDCYVITIYMGVTDAATLRNTASVSYDPGINHTRDTAEVLPNGTTGSYNTIEKVYYQLSSTNTGASTNPYVFDEYITNDDENGRAVLNETSLQNGLASFKANGVQYKSVNGTQGYRTISGPSVSGFDYQNGSDAYSAANINIIETANTNWTSGDSQANKLQFTEAGWYTFLIQYKEYYSTGEESSDGQSQVTWHYVTKLAVINVKVTEDDISAQPSATAIDNTIAIFNSGAELTSVNYQLTSVDLDAATIPVLYSTWYRYCQTGKGFDADDNPVGDADVIAKFTEANGSSGTRSTGSGLYGVKQIVLTQPGWYTVILNYNNSAGTAKQVIKYLYFSEENINYGVPRINKTGNNITVSNFGGTISQVLYQLTTYDEQYIDENYDDGAAGYLAAGTDFIEDYGYGSGRYYTTIGQDKYRKQNSTGDFTIFSRIGLFETEEDFNTYNAETNDTRSALLLKTNGSAGYRSAHLSTEDSSANITVRTAGWYTLRITYGTVTITRYVQITEADIQGANAPTASINETTGEITVNANGHVIKNAFINLATKDYLTQSTYPAGKSGLAYYLTAGNAYSFYGYYTYGQTHYTDVNPADGYYTVDIGQQTDATGSFAVTTAGWYNLYITYDERTDSEGNKVVDTKIVHVLLPESVTGPEIAQYNDTSVNVTSSIDTEGTYTDKRMMISYTDPVTSSSKTITKVMYGLITDEKSLSTYDGSGKYTVGSWYRMSLATDGDVTLLNGQIDGAEGGRNFNIVVDKTGEYIVAVYDKYYGNKYYYVTVTDEDVPVTSAESQDAARITVTGNVISAANGDGNVRFIKDVTETADVDYNKGYTLTLKEGGVRAIRTIDSVGRVSQSLVTTDTFDADKTELKALIEQAERFIQAYTPLEQAAYDEQTESGYWAVNTAYEGLEALITATDGEIVTPKDVYDSESVTVAQIDEAVAAMQTAIEEFRENSKEIDPELVYVRYNGNGTADLVVDAGANTLVKVVYSAQEYYTIVNGIGSREISQQAWDSWAGISSEDFVEAAPNATTYEITDVDDGIYTFMVKVGDAVYFRNPVVSKNDQTDEGRIAQVKAFLDGSASYDPDDLLTEGQQLLNTVSTYTEFTQDNSNSPFVSDVLYEALQGAYNNARAQYNNTTDLDTLKEVTIDLNNRIRQVKESMRYEVQEHEIEFTVTNADTGAILATNTSDNVTTMFVAKGEYDKWSTFAKASYQALEITDNGETRTSEFNVQGDGTYTAYVKYEDGTYEFATFELDGYGGYPLIATHDGSNIVVAIKDGAVKSNGNAITTDDVTELAIAYGIQYSYSASDSDTWKSLTWDGNSATRAMLGSGEHTVHALIDGIEYFIPAYPNETPIVRSISNNENGGKVIVFSDSSKIAWVAYAAGEHTSWTQMLQSTAGVHYIAQNEEVIIRCTVHILP